MPVFDLSNCPCCHPPCGSCDVETFPPTAFATAVINGYTRSFSLDLTINNCSGFSCPNWYYSNIYHENCGGEIITPIMEILVFMGCFDGSTGFQVYVKDDLVGPIVLWNTYYLAPITGSSLTCDPFHFHWSGIADEQFVNEGGGEICGIPFTTGDNTLEITIDGTY